MARNILVILLIIAALYIGYEKILRNPSIRPADLEKIYIYDELGRDIKAEFEAEIADSPYSRQRGLMFRETLSEDNGMLFVFKREGRYPMWMKNTYIPLDMIFINSSRQVVELVENTEPESETSYGGSSRSSYVLEVNAGTIEKYDINIGDVVKGISKVN